MTEALQVAVATIGRFHSFDLARELQARGCLAAIFSGYPRARFRDTGVDTARIRSFPWLQTPTEALRRAHLLPDRAYRHLAWRARESFDRHVARTLPRCHVLSALSGSGLHAGSVAQAQDAAWVCDRGSTHIAFQDAVLREEYDRLGLRYQGIDARLIDKELAEYAGADAITVPSGFALRSFLDHGVPADRLHRIPYGVEPAAIAPGSGGDGTFRVLFVGQLSVRKGLIYLLRAFARAGLANARLVLVGSPQAETETLLARAPVQAIERTGPLPPARVMAEMARAAVLVLPSVEDGFGLVLAQALACGCPVIATAHTGAPDLIEDGVEGFIVPVRDPDAIADRLARLHRDATLRAQMSAAALRRVRRIGGWESYGRQSAALFHSLAVARGHHPAPLREPG